MKTVCVQIGNSDDKLTQREWSEFIAEMRWQAEQFQIHFWGASVNYEPWQNVCFIIEVADELVEQLKQGISNIRFKYRQDSAAVLVGDTEFI